MHKWRWRFLTLWLIAFTTIDVIGIKLHEDAIGEGTQSHKAICALIADYRNRALAGKDFLSKHPHGIPGIPASLIKNSVHNQILTLKVLDKAVTC